MCFFRSNLNKCIPIQNANTQRASPYFRQPPLPPAIALLLHPFLRQLPSDLLASFGSGVLGTVKSLRTKGKKICSPIHFHGRLFEVPLAMTFMLPFFTCGIFACFERLFFSSFLMEYQDGTYGSTNGLSLNLVQFWTRVRFVFKT